MDTSDPEITFDSQAHCNHCNAFLAHGWTLTHQDRQVLDSLVAKIKARGRNSEYDCVMGVSGGVDSSYAVAFAVRLGLRPLAVHLDNGWNSEEAVRNIRSLCSILKIDYQSHVLDWEEFKDLQLSFLRSSIVEMEIPTDIAILAVLHQAAAKHGVRYILSGGNMATEGILPQSWFYDPKDGKLLRAIHKQFGRVKLKSFPLFDFPREIYYKFLRGIRMVYFLNYVDYNKDRAKEILINEYGWKDYGGKHHESRFTKFVQNYAQPMKFGIDYRRATFSTQICMNTLTRDDALKELQNPPYDPAKVDTEKDYIAKKLEITLDELESILNAPPRSYRDYPNNERLLQFLYRCYTTIFAKRAR